MFRLGWSTRINQAPPLHRELAQKKKTHNPSKMFIICKGKNKTQFGETASHKRAEDTSMQCSESSTAEGERRNICQGDWGWLWRMENRKHRKEAENPSYTLDERTCRHCQGLRPETAEDVGLPEVNNWEKGLSRCHSKFPHSASVEGIACGGTHMVTRESASFLVPLIIWLYQSP